MLDQRQALACTDTALCADCTLMFKQEAEADQGTCAASVWPETHSAVKQLIPGESYALHGNVSVVGAQRVTARGS